MMTFLRKIAQAIALFLVGLGLDLVGYQEPINDIVQTQSQSTLLGIRLMFFIGPVVLLVIGIVFSYLYKISPKNHVLLMAEIERLKQGESKNSVSDESKEVVESITGIAYENLWVEEI